MTGAGPTPDEPAEPLIGRGRSGGGSRSPAEARAPRSIPRPQLEPARWFVSAWTPARLRLGLGVALIAVLGGAWFTLSSRATPTGAGIDVPPPSRTTSTAASEPDPTTAPRPRVQPVPSWVPRAIASTCHAHTAASSTETVVVDCAPGRGIATLRYRQLTSSSALAAAFQAKRHGGAGPSGCAQGRTDERAWSDATAPAIAEGRYRCTQPHGRARIEWTDGATRVLAVATRADGDLRSLYTWWTTVPGPVASGR